LEQLSDRRAIAHDVASKLDPSVRRHLATILSHADLESAGQAFVAEPLMEDERAVETSSGNNVVSGRDVEPTRIALSPRKLSRSHFLWHPDAPHLRAPKHASKSSKAQLKIDLRQTNQCS
jgi:hypothetical protein